MSVIEEVSSSNHRTLGDISEKVFESKKAKTFVELSILCCQLSVCISYLRYFGEQMNDLICQRTNGEFCGHRTLFASIGVVLLSLLALLKNFKQLSLISLIANCTVFLALISVSIDSLTVIIFRSHPIEL